MKIVSGIYKGRFIKTLYCNDIRPTSAKVREAIFGKIQFHINNAKFLDLFSGSGAMGIEALSRGASKVVFNDKSIKSVRIIKENLNNLKAEADIINLDYKSAIISLRNNKFDFIFIDPPYNLDCINKILQLIDDNNILEDNGVIIYEHINEKVLNINKSLYIIVDEKRYSLTTVSYIKRN